MNINRSYYGCQHFIKAISSKFTWEQQNQFKTFDFINHIFFIIIINTKFVPQLILQVEFLINIRLSQVKLIFTALFTRCMDYIDLHIRSVFYFPVRWTVLRINTVRWLCSTVHEVRRSIRGSSPWQLTANPLKCHSHKNHDNKCLQDERKSIQKPIILPAAFWEQTLLFWEKEIQLLQTNTKTISCMMLSSDLIEFIYTANVLCELKPPLKTFRFWNLSKYLLKRSCRALKHCCLSDSFSF